MDCTVQGPLEVRIREDGTVIWITTKEGTIFRACQISHLVVYDDRSRATTVFSAEEIAAEQATLLPDKPHG